jgi:exonuclease SbcD
MKLLHTGDLHLGKSLHEQSLLEDQRVMLDQLANELGKDRYAALVIAGDVYDRTIPGAEAVELFSDFLVTVRERHPELDVCIIPGNHDSAQRLSFADRILGTQRIHIIGNPADSFAPIILGNGGERLAIFLLPFLAAGTLKPVGSDRPEGFASGSTAGSAAGNNPGQVRNSLEFDFSQNEDDRALPADRPLLSQAELAGEASRRFAEALAKKELAGIPTVLVAHLFTLAGVSSESERIFLGQAEQVNPSLFSRFSYVALGHLHRCQKVTDRMYYSGSPLAYSFDEAGFAKNFLKVEIDGASPGFPVSVTPIPVVPHRAVTRLAGSFTDFHTGTAFDRHAADWLEITLNDGALVANPMNLLKPKFPGLLSIRQDFGDAFCGASETDGAEENGLAAETNGTAARRDAAQNPVSDFRAFEDMLHQGIDEDRVKLFTSLLSECADEA